MFKVCINVHMIIYVFVILSFVMFISLPSENLYWPIGGAVVSEVLAFAAYCTLCQFAQGALPHPV